MVYALGCHSGREQLITQEFDWGSVPFGLDSFDGRQYHYPTHYQHIGASVRCIKYESEQDTVKDKQWKIKMQGDENQITYFIKRCAGFILGSLPLVSLRACVTMPK